MSLFNELLFRPLFNLLVALYNTIAGNDLGLAIIFVTVAVRLLFTPLTLRTLRSQKKLQNIQPKLREVQEKYKNDKQALAQATMAIYSQEKVNPFGGCAPLIIQIPVLLALYRALTAIFDPKNYIQLYSFVKNPGIIQSISLGFIDIAHKNPFLAVVAGLLQGLQSWQAQKNGTMQMSGDAGSMAAMNKQLLYFFPVMVIIISWNLPTGIVLYWVVTTTFTIFEQSYLRRFI